MYLWQIPYSPSHPLSTQSPHVQGKIRSPKRERPLHPVSEKPSATTDRSWCNSASTPHHLGAGTPWRCICHHLPELPSLTLTVLPSLPHWLTVNASEFTFQRNYCHLIPCLGVCIKKSLDWLHPSFTECPLCARHHLKCQKRYVSGLVGLRIPMTAETIAQKCKAVCNKTHIPAYS